MLKVSPWKGIFRFGKRGKLSPRFVGPFKILERIGSVAYRLELPLELSNIHDVFHISNLKKCLNDESLIVPLEELQIDDKLQFTEEPVEVMDREVKEETVAVAYEEFGINDYLYHDIKVLILELYLVNPCVAEQKTLIVLSVDTPFTGRIASPLAIKDNGEDALTALAITNFVYSAMANPGENYIYQRFPYIILDDTPSDSSGSSSGAVPSHASSVSSQVGPQLPATPPGSPFVPPLPPGSPFIPPPPGSPPVHSPPHSPLADASAMRRQSSSPHRAPAWDGLRRMRG
ncbi:hypothetical protein E3N88_42867 [Mikania micrantha]|uniref:Tf2-1-like SH3-like domain-containing protein n=1 Tax=Mikania micrantha TaxID=192012 RepID=A0A5N6LGK6_9ASTR|nr:hypothetical protein E3N88_42867 [Mikania micrantha]